MNRVIAFLFTSTLLFSLQNSKAQDPQIIWQNTIGGDKEDDLSDVIKVTGGYILVGSSNSNISGDKTSNSVDAYYIPWSGPGSAHWFDTYDVWIVKISETGNIVWQRQYGCEFDEVPIGIFNTMDGGFILSSNVYNSGASFTNGYFCYSSNFADFSSDYLLTKFNMNGYEEWTLLIEGTNFDYLRSIINTPDGGYLLGGESNSDSSFYKSQNAIPAFNGNPTIDFWIVKIDSLGNVMWDKTIGGSNNDFFANMIVSDNSYYFIGSSSSPAGYDKTEDAFNMSYDIWIVKTDNSGNVIWDKTIGGNSSDNARAIKEYDNGDLLVCGNSVSDSSGLKTENSKGSSDYWILKLDSLGNILWQKTIGGSKNDNMVEMLIDENGRIIMGGQSESGISGDKTEESNGFIDFWFVYLDSLGNLQSQKTIGSNKNDYLGTIELSTNGNIFFAGHSNSLVSGDKNEDSFYSTFWDNYYNSWITRYTEDYWIGELTDSVNTITGKVFIDSNANGILDSLEFGFKSGKIEVSNGSLIYTSIPNSDGVFNLKTNKGSWITSFTPNSQAYYTVNPLQSNSNFGTQFGQLDTINFAVEPIPGKPDLQIDIIPLNPVRPGFDATYRLITKNIGTDTINGNVQFVHDPLLIYSTSTPIYDSYIGNVLSWSYIEFAPDSEMVFDILLQVPAPPAFNIGDIVNQSASILPIIGDLIPGNNSSSISQVAIGSFDPNDKWVSDAFVLDTSLSDPDYLSYLIRFQNTGTDTAINVKVTDLISENLDMTTLSIIYTSHNYTMSITKPHKIEWNFENILLPDSNVNEPASHGYIYYKIKPKINLSIGEKIENYASIYFDFNPAVITNTTITQVILAVGINSPSTKEQILIYPNPATNQITIVSPNNYFDQGRLTVFNALGQQVHSEPIEKMSQKKKVIDTRTLVGGIYYIRISQNETQYNGKFIINR